MCDASDSDDSDIAVMFAKAEKQARVESEDDDDDSDSDDDDDEEVVMELPSKRGRSQTVDAKLARFGQARNIRKRNSAQGYLKSSRSDDDTDSDNDELEVNHQRYKDVGAIDVEVVHILDGEENEEPSNRSKQKAKLFDGDSSDDEDVTLSTRKSISELRKQGANEADLEVLRKAQQTLSGLQRAEADSQLKRYRDEATQNQQYLRMESQQRQQEAMKRMQTFGMTIRATFKRRDEIEKEEDTVLMVHGGLAFSTVQGLFLQHHKLDLKTSTLFFRFNDKPIHLARSIADYQISAGSVVEASVLLSGFKPSNSKSSSTSYNGQLLKLTLRRAITSKNIEDDVLEIGSKDTFSVLMEKYKEKKKLGRAKQVVFKFDGEPLRPNQTPAMLDMESEDLIDVTVQ